MARARVSDADIVAAATAAGVDPGLYRRVVAQESRGYDVTSPKGARGPAQLMPATARSLGVDINDPIANLNGGARYLRQQVDTFGDPGLAAAAYNAGPGAVQRYGGVPPFRETRAYVAAVTGGQNQGGGSGADIFAGPEPQQPLQAAQGQPQPGGSGADIFAASQPQQAPGWPRIKYDNANPAVAGQELPQAQSDAYAAHTRSPIWDANAPVGSNARPYAEVQGSPVPFGKAYYDAQGQFHPANDTAASADNRGGFLRGLGEAGSRFAEPFSAAAHDSNTAANPIGAWGGALLTGVGNAIGTLNPVHYGEYGAPDTSETQAQARAHPFFYDPQHVATNRERDDAFGLDVLSAIPLDKLAAMAPRAANVPPMLPRLTGQGRAVAAPRVPLTPPKAAPFQNAADIPRVTPQGAIDPNVPLSQQLANAVRNPTSTFKPPAPPIDAPRLGPVVLPPTPAAVTSRAAAEAKVASVLKSALGRDGVAPSALPDIHAQDSTALALHGIGPNTEAVAEVIAKSPGPGRTIIRKAIENARKDAPLAVRSAITEATGGDRSALAITDQMRADRAANANEGMTRFGNDPVTLNAPPGVGLRGPRTLSALQDTAQTALSHADPAEQQAGQALMDLHTQLADGATSKVTLRVRDAQNVSAKLLDQADKLFTTAQRGLPADTNLATSLKSVGRKILDEAAAQHPAYGAWLSQYGSASDEARAFKLGLGLFREGSGLENTPPAVAKALKGLRGDNIAGTYTRGVGEALMEQVRRSGGDTAAVRRVLNNQNVQDRLRMAFPDQRAYDNFIKAFERHAAKTETNNRLYGGSPTEPLAAARADLEQGGQNMAQQGADALGWLGGAASALHGNPAPLAGKALMAAIKKLPTGIDASVIKNPLTNEILARALTDPAEMQRLMGVRGRGARPIPRTPPAR